MSYPPGSPGNAGYQAGPPAQQFNTHAQQYGQAAEAEPAGPSKLPVYLAGAVAGLGLAVYLTTFGLDAGITDGGIAAALAGLLAGIGLLPKQKGRTALAAALAVLGFLIVLSVIVAIGIDGLSWPAYLLLAFTLLQALTAVGALLLESGVIAAPVPKPRYEQSYGQYGAPGQYYGQSHQGATYQQGPQRPGYAPPQQYGGYPSNPSTGGFGAQQGAQLGAKHAPPTGPPTPPTGFPAFGQPQGATHAAQQQPSSDPPTTQHASQQSAPPPS